MEAIKAIQYGCILTTDQLDEISYLTYLTSLYMG